jgi:hypothetical protein
MKAWLLLCLPFLSAAAPPPDPATTADVRCVIVVGSALDTKDPQVKQLAFSTMLYFLGRIDGRAPGFDIKGAWDAEMKKITGKERKALIDSCIDQVQKRLARDL